MSAAPTPSFPRPEILDRLPAGGHHVIEASAGTGKTFTIERLVVARLLEGADLTKLLVVTFSERAAAELRARIRALLVDLLRCADGGALAAVQEPSWLLDEVARQRLRTALSRIDAAQISTIHSFCQRLITENAFAHRRLFAQSLVDGLEAFRGVFRTFLRTRLATDADFALLMRERGTVHGMDADEGLRELEKELHEVVSFHGRLVPDLVEVVPLLDEALAALPQPLPDVASIAAAYKARGKGTRQGKSIEKYMTPLLDALGKALQTSGIGRLIALNAVSTEGPGRLKGDEGPGTLSLVQFGIEVLTNLPPGAHPELLQLFTLLERDLPQSEVLLHSKYRDELQELFRRSKEEQGVFDYDDMLKVVAASLEGDSAEQVRRSQRERYDYVLIDEFQDTDPIQWKVFQTIFVQPDCKPWVTVIGDPKQAIYGFRGADVETYLGAREALLGESDSAKLLARIVRLKENYRSSDRMIRAYNLVLKQAPVGEAPLFQADARITYGDEVAVSCGDPSSKLMSRGHVELPAITAVRLDPNEKEPGGLLGFGRIPRFVAAEICRLLGEGGPLFVDKRWPEGRPLRADDIYVLARAKKDAQAVGEELGRVGVPFSFYKLEGLFESDEVADLIDVLSAAARPMDRRCRVQAWLTPLFGLSPAEAERALDASDEHPLVRQLLRWHELARRRDFRLLFSALLEESGVAARAALLPSGERSLTNLMQVLELLSEEARRRHATLDELIELLRSWRAGLAQPPGEKSDTQPLSTDRPAVQLMTMHAAKGLEAPVVFLAGGTGRPHGSFLNVFHQDGERCAALKRVPKELLGPVEREQRGEDERLLYVALTRAKVRLYLPHYVEVDKNGKVGAMALRGTYGLLNERLFQVLKDAPDRTLLDVIELGEPPAPLIEDTQALTSWTLPAPAQDDLQISAERRALSLARRGPLVTSYSQLAQGMVRPGIEVDRLETTGETSQADTQPDELVTSAVVGNFLHEALEALELAHVAGMASCEVFAQDGAVRGCVEPLASAAGILASQRPHAYRLLWAALRSPLSLGSSGMISSIAALPKVQREMEFLFPIPEASHRLLGQAAGGPGRSFVTERGLVKGFIDVVFEHDGRVYFGDWKSSVLRSSSPEALQRTIDTHFHWQVVVYGVAVLRLLGIADEAAFEKRFGGFLYLFLREMARTPAGADTRGVWFERPTWAQVVAWERELLEHDYVQQGATP